MGVSSVGAARRSCACLQPRMRKSDDQDDADVERPEEDALVAADHGWAPGCARWGGRVGVAAPEEQRRAIGLGDALLVGGVGDEGGAGEEWRDLDRDRRAGERVDRLDRGVGKVDRQVGATNSNRDLVCEAKALGDAVRLGGVPRASRGLAARGGRPLQG